MSRKILIVGGVAGGASAAARLRRLNENDKIIMFEKGPHVSFSNCCLPYHLSEVIEDAESLVLMQPDKFFNQYRIDARINNEVIDIDRTNKKIKVKDLINNKEYEESYDKLILSPGANPIVPNIPGIENINVFTVRNVVDIAKLKYFANKSYENKVTVIGGGFVGVEVTENLREAGYDVTLIEASKQIMKPFDYDMVQILHKELDDKGVNLILEDKVVAFEDGHTVLDSGRKIKSDVVIMAIGVSPDTKLAKQAGLDIGETGSIKVDHNYCTNDKDIYAVGDAIEVYNTLTHRKTRLPLAGPAQKQARAVADHINNIQVRNTGFIGSSVIKVFDLNGASTGLNENMIKELDINIDYEVARVIPSDKVGLMPGASPMHFKLIFEVPTGKILGAQAIGKGSVDKRVDVIATLIKFGATVEDLKDLELCYAPTFSTAKDVVNHAGYVASNLLSNTFKQVPVTKVRELVENGEYIIDVREENEFELGHVVGAKNIPLSQLRDRLDEIPKDKILYVHCRSAQRSYNAVLALKQLGFENVYNIAGSFLGICLYEYFNDKTKNRKPIVTQYNFN
ncbi:FAD-dependent oxidoreductase [Romboutsia sp. 1001216sp1]|uniref:FAD-dependent oxidoreductase n=1 Tax=unclassified Romboutsia TaxID=2626894 RepID=UPI0018AC2171|nr:MULTISPECIES: FAD-dependent oxidoreductase [unclassified Romboutsia]MDB8793003.1 FAD-dependent oxidoreductase [Romboutsia sp. 1001216sp1]MDB8795194.1 FAD-dependent oxidoreductase [Romboutsia sp. 1001216sp1]MDB8799003.1 FAD-dependent oxidoreductase [Romboutsia sp. 1001216sp1]